MNQTKLHLIIIGDEILSGKRQDKHMSKVIEILSSRGLQLSGVEYIGDEPAAITQGLQRAFEKAKTGDIVFSTGGIGATPDDHTRQCAAKALGVALVLHPDAKAKIYERMQDMAIENKHAFDPERPDNLHRLKMGEFPVGSHIIPNTYNKIPGFYVRQGNAGGAVYFVPGFPVMAWPMVEWALDTHHAHLFQQSTIQERSVLVAGAMESTLTPLMEEIEVKFAGVKVFSLPSVDHPKYGRHIELGVKGRADSLEAAFEHLKSGLAQLKCQLIDR